MPEMDQIFTGESHKPNRRIPFNVKLLGSYKDHVWAILGPWYGYFYNIFASRCLKWLTYSLERCACQIEEYHSVSNYWDHIRAMFWLFLQYLCFQVPEMAQISVKCHAYQVKVTLCWIVWIILRPCLGNIRAMFWLFLQYLCFLMP